MTVYDIARRAGVSTATVSRVVNNKGSVSAKTRDRILRIMEEGDFKVNELARSLATQNTRTVAVLAADIREYYYSQIAYKIDRNMAKEGYRVYYCNMGTESEDQARAINDMLTRRVSGIILIGTPSQSDLLLSTLLSASLRAPVVVNNMKIPGENIYCIERDDAAGIRSCIDHLVGLGCKNLAFLLNMYLYSDRLKRGLFEDYTASLAASLGDKAVSARVFTCEPGIEGGRAYAEKLLEVWPEADGVVCATDPIAVGLVKGLRDMDVPIPERIKITGYDNTEISLYTTPSITSVDSDMELQGVLAAEIMLNCLDGTKMASNYRNITPKLVIRESTVS